MNFLKNNAEKSFEILLNNFLSKINYGTLEVTFPSGNKKYLKERKKVILLIFKYIIIVF